MKLRQCLYVFLSLPLMLLASCGDRLGHSPSDSTQPNVSLNGAASITLFLNDSYTELGATASDNVDGALLVAINGNVDVATVGTYILTYSATNTAGNVGNMTRSVHVVARRPFITTWKTDNSGTSGNNEVKIGTLGGGYNYDVDWGDGQTSVNLTGDETHTYASAGTYTVSISGAFPQIYFNAAHDNDKLLTIEQWGDGIWQSMQQSFYNCSNVVSNATDSPDLSLVSDMSSMFRGANAFNQDIGAWNVSTVTMMQNTFRDATIFNQDISTWDVSSVTTMQSMFQRASAFNQNIGSWDVSAVTTMQDMFYGASVFNQPINAWDVSAVTNMVFTFSGAFAFNQDIGDWDVSSVLDMYAMFETAANFNQDIGDWVVSSVTDMGGMFYQAYAFNQNLELWNVSSVTNMSFAFYNATSFDQNIGAWDVTSVTDMTSMFENIALSTTNYDALLLGWSAQSLQNNVTFSGGNSIYTNQAARDVLTGAPFNWIVTDGGM